MIKDVRVSDRHRQKGIIENHRGFPSEEITVFGGDTETVFGAPYTLQLSGPPTRLTHHEVHGSCEPLKSADEIIFKVNPKTIFLKMMTWILPRVRDHHVNLAFFHNLNFDLRTLFYTQHQLIYDQYNDIRFNQDGFAIKMLFGRVNKADIWEDFGGYICPKCPEPIPKGATEFIKTDSGFKRVCTRHTKYEPAVKRNLGTKISLMDSAAFCPPGGKSLKSALKIYGVPEQKMQAPDGLGTKKFWGDKYSMEYALNDARVERLLGLKILDLHREYDVCPSVSLPQLSARILRHHFFRPGERLEFPPEGCRRASELSYHAGKNGFYVKRGIYENVYEYDINSAFPKAMHELSQMVKGKYQKLKKRSFALASDWSGSVLSLFRISGNAKGAVYPSIFDHNFTPIKEGRFKHIWVTGFELDCLKNNPDYEYKIEEGWKWVPEAGYTHSPLRDFVEKFWSLKQKAPKGAKRDTYKNILNSLYGKFAACVEKRPSVYTYFGNQTVKDPTNVGGPRYFEAGALYHPFIASQITGYVRRELYNLEVQGQAMHSATDAIKTFKKLPVSNELGGLKLEAYGRCYLFRTKLYLHFSKTTEYCGHDLSQGWVYGQKIFDVDQHLCKWATHGFKGGVIELFQRRHELMKNGYLDYDFQHMVSLREGIKREEKISTMVTRKERLVLNNSLVDSN